MKDDLRPIEMATIEKKTHPENISIGKGAEKLKPYAMLVGK